MKKIKNNFKKEAQEATLDHVFDFGEHKGDTLREVIDKKINYVEWCLGQKIFTMNLDAKKYYTSKAIEPISNKKNWRY